MTAATTLKFSKIRVLAQRRCVPPVYSAPCGFNARALNRSKNLNEVVVPDYDEAAEEEDAPAWVGREVISLTWGVTGEGVLACELLADWEDFYNSTGSRGVRVEIECPAPAGLLAMEGLAHLASYTIGANRGEKGTLTVDLQGDGALVPVAP